MIRSERFLVSQRPYAINLDSMTLQQRPGESWRVQLQAVWFRRRSGLWNACRGYLWDYQPERPASAQQAAERHEDGRYGGHCLARLSPHGYWAESDVHPEIIQLDLALLEPMLRDVGAVPDGYDGWYHFGRK